MEKPYRYRKKLVPMGNSVAVIIPKVWLQGQLKRLKRKKILDVILEAYKDKVVITPAD